MNYESFSIKTLKLIRQKYPHGTEQYMRLTELIQLAQYRLKHGEAAYKQLLENRLAPICEETVNPEQVALF